MALEYKLLLHNLSCFLSDEGTDEVYLTYRGEKIWPLNEKFTPMKAGSTANVELEISILKGATASVELWESDTFSKDDNLGKFLLEADKIGGPYTTDMIKADKGKSKYGLTWEVGS
ncbi:MAG: hypothetical protein KDC79_15555 [Cyclobacteriaceae bacterium]|nr:hypothetical protein [Cyclobacteriaceae bacterium]